MTSLDDALERLGRALDQAGVDRWRPPADDADLEALEVAIAPMRLPVDVREFWRRVDCASLRVRPALELVGPASALRAWRFARDEAPEAQPLALVLVGSESLWCLSGELETDGRQGGTLFEWNIVDGGFTRRFNAFPEWLVAIAQQLEGGRFDRREDGSGTKLRLFDPSHPGEAWPELPPHALYGTTTCIERDILAWPESWQRAAGIRPEDLEPRGATHTIAELLASPGDVEIRGTIAGEVVSLAGGGRWARVRVDDGTGTIDVHCPAEATLLGPGIRRRYEFDVLVAPGERLVPPEEPSAADFEDPASHLTAVLMARHGGLPAARAERIRRLP